MGSKIVSKLRFWQRSGSEVEEMAFGGPGLVAVREAPRSLTIAEGPDGKVALIQVTETTEAGYRKYSNADILCIDFHRFGASKILNWINEDQAAAIARYDGPACITVLGNLDQLSVEQLSEISDVIEPAGAIFQAWPKGCKSFEEAFDAFGKGVAANYQWPAFVG
jgi:hypothetical protein